MQYLSILSVLILLLRLYPLFAYTATYRNGHLATSKNMLYAVGTNDSDKDYKPFAVIVQAEIVPERMDEFLKLIENNAIQSRQEEQCIRFDVIQSQDQENKFFFYEIYKNSHSAMDYHKSQSHYMAWANFKESGGTISSVTYKASGLFLSE
jgi:(4S)-4-hydroxy-5-phosphonooxypentane-2,3-dione isomerase